MLFRYDPETGKPLKTMLVDLQLFREACPTLDLVYFIYTGTTPEFRKEYLNQLLELYADSFLHYCKVLEVKTLPGFSCAELKRRFHLGKIFGLIISIMLLPIMLSEPEDAPDLDTLKRKRYSLGVETDLENMGEMMKAINQSASRNTCLADRFVGLAREFYVDGVL